MPGIIGREIASDALEDMAGGGGCSSPPWHLCCGRLQGSSSFLCSVYHLCETPGRDYSKVLNEVSYVTLVLSSAALFSVEVLGTSLEWDDIVPKGAWGLLDPWRQADIRFSSVAQSHF